MSVNKNKFIFIDSNIYYGLFTKSEKFSDDIIKLLTKLVKKDKITLLLPQQVIDEVSRDKICKWPNEELERLEEKIKTFDKKIVQLDQEFGNLSFVNVRSIELIKNQIKRELIKLDKNHKVIEKRYLSSHSKANINLKRVFELAVLVEENEDIINKALYRREKGNPPIDKARLGDKLIWESILSFFINKKLKNFELVFVSGDKNAWFDKNKDNINAWLLNEFQQKTKGSIKLIADLSGIPTLTSKEQMDIWEEEFKNIIDSKLKYANTFARADVIIQKIIDNIHLIDNQIADRLLFAALENNEYSFGPYNQVLEASQSSIFLQKLLKHYFDNKFDLDPWVLFYNKLDDGLKVKFSIIRQQLKSKHVTGLINPGGDIFLDPEDIPF